MNGERPVLVAIHYQATWSQRAVEQEQIEEFCKVTEAAYQGLRLGTSIGGKPGRHVCRYLALPSFENATGWEVRLLRVRRQPPEPRVFRTVWRRDLDYAVFSSPIERGKHPRPFTPTLETNSALIDPAKTEEFVTRLRNAQLPLGIAESPVGTDGTTYELEIGDFFARIQIAWWNRLPAEWLCLQPIIDEMMGFFHESFERG